mgnify:FL=1|jgi:DNA polymerase elongation subunit (family B)|tara:strand:- start:678 stop:2444 length:1767 start_codon:yes stop_codon:yes gene_type:complete
MSYKKCYVGEKKGWNTYEMHLWESDGEHQKIIYENFAYVEDKDSYTCRGLNGEYLKPTLDWRFSRNEKYRHKNTPKLHFHDMKVHQKFLLERYGTNDVPSTGHKEMFFDIECEMLDSFDVEEIEKANKIITSIAFWDKKSGIWGCLILDPKGQVEKSKTVIPYRTEKALLTDWVGIIQETKPDCLIGYNSDSFDMPYLYYRICNVCGKDIADMMSPLYGYVDEPIKSKKYSNFFYASNMFITIEGIESLDYMRLHKKYSWKDEPSWKLDSIGEKYVGVKKIEYDGNLNDLYTDDIHKFVEYNFRDVEILKLLDEKLDYLALTRNISHKGKHNYSEVYANTTTQDGAISAYLIGQGIIPNNKEINPQKKQGYAGGWLFCPQAGLYENMFDLDLTSLYPAIIRTINIGKETYVGRIIDIDDRNNRLGLSDLKSMDQKELITFENTKGLHERWEVGKIVKAIQNGNYRVAANGSFFSSDRKSTLSVILEKWFNERVEYKNLMKSAYKSGDTEKGKYYHLMQYTMKILLNSLYGATAVPNFRYGMNFSILSEAITLSGHRIIQESALCANKFYSKIMEGKITKEEFINKLEI